MTQFPQDPCYDIGKIKTELSGMKIDYHRKLGSTNDRGIELAREDSFVSPTLVLTEQQFAGRGQRERTWWSSVESVTLSWCIERLNSTSSNSAQKSLTICPSLLSIATGIAVVETLAELAPELNDLLKIKWPNDVLIDRKKVSGILIESITRPNATVYIVGIGMNINQPQGKLPSLESAPQRGHFAPSSLRAELRSDDRQFDRTALVVGTIGRLSKMLLDQSNTGEKLALLVNPRISFLNQNISFETSNKEIIQGTVVGISPDGGLILRTTSGHTTLFSGSILPPVPPHGH